MVRKRFIQKIFLNELLIICLATIFSILYQGYYFARTDQVFYLPYLMNIKDSSLFTNDLLVSTLNEVYFGNLWRLIAIIAKFIPVELLFLTLHIAFRFLLFYLIYLLSLKLFKKKRIAYLSVILWFIPKPSLGFEIFYNEFVQSEVSLVLLLSSILFFLKDKNFISFILLGIAFHIHPPMAVYIFLGYVLFLVYRIDVRSLVKLISIVFVISIPILIPALSHAKNITGYDQIWLELLRIRASHHSFPLSWPREIWLEFFLFFGLFIAGLKHIRKKLTDKAFFKLYFLLFYLITIMVAGFIFSEIIPIPGVIITVPFRIGGIFTILASFVVTYYVYNLVLHKSKKLRTVGYILFIVLFFNNFDLLINRSQIVIVLISISGIILASKVFLLRDAKTKYFASLNIFLLSLFILWLPFMVKQNITRTDIRYQAWVDTQKWAKGHTRKDATFIVPIYESGFRVYSERSIIADWKDGVGGYLSPGFFTKWWERMSDFGLDKNRYNDAYQKTAYLNMEQDKVKKIAQKYNASYFVTEAGFFYTFPKLYANKHYIVYGL